jgi:hypothetical protein
LLERNRFNSETIWLHHTGLVSFHQVPITWKWLHK